MTDDRPRRADRRHRSSDAICCAANAIAHALARALDAGHHPFGALLVGPDHETVLIEQGNVDSVNHAEAVLARDAARRYSPDELWPCTLVTTVEPCAMCAGTQYWANIGRVVYGMEERRLLADSPATIPRTRRWTCPAARSSRTARRTSASSARWPEVEAEITALHRRYWRSR